MPRARRLCVPGIPLHVIQRGNNRKRCFFRPSDYVSYLNTLLYARQRYKVAVHAYVLMTNHVHMLVTPENEDSVSRMMQFLGREYVMQINSAYSRTGTLWEGRFKSSLVDSENYCLTCYKYIELNPVRAGIVQSPADYRWSSFRANALGGRSSIIHPRPEWLKLGNSRRTRCRHYRSLFDTAITNDDLVHIRNGYKKGCPVGTAKFKREIQATLAARKGL